MLEILNKNKKNLKTHNNYFASDHEVSAINNIYNTSNPSKHLLFLQLIRIRHGNSFAVNC